MTFVEQRRRGSAGDCVAACVASILDLPLDAVPDLSPGAVEDAMASGAIPQAPGGWDPQTWALALWLRERGLDAVDVYPWCAEDGFGRLDVSGMAIAGAWSPRMPGCGHAVVMLDGALLWDPHPERHLGIGPIYGWTILTTEGGERLRPTSWRVGA